MEMLVLGSGIVGSAAVWDLTRRGHKVVVADADGDAGRRVGARFGATPHALNVEDRPALTSLLESADVVVSAIPYRFGFEVAHAALETGTHYLDFGGNPTVVSAQKALNREAQASGVMIVPDCGLAPGLANVLGEDLIRSAGDETIDTLQLRVGALPQKPKGALGYQLAFSAAGLVNEYAEPCEVIENGSYGTVEPLTRLEEVPWDSWGPLEAFSTAGGTSTMCTNHEGRVNNLEYKTLRFPGHAIAFRALLELGMFDESPRTIGEKDVVPRSVLLDALTTSLPTGAPDVVLIRVWCESNGVTTGYQLEDTASGGFSALARTTAFPATALAHLIAEGRVIRPGVLTMNEAVLATELLPQLDAVGIEIEPF